MLFRYTQLLILALILVALIAGCNKVGDEGTPFANQPPTTRITSAPGSLTTVDHYVYLRWSGNDPDGDVVSYRVYVDSVLYADSLFAEMRYAFSAPIDSVPVLHSFSVRAVDNQGAEDPDPPVRRFYTLNKSPVVKIAPSDTLLRGANVGRGFRITLTAEDINRSPIEFSLSLDSPEQWTAWSPDSVFYFVAPEVMADSATLPEHSVMIDNTPLTPGAHWIYYRARDAGLAVSPIESLTVFVRENFWPVFELPVTAQYGTQEFYADGSIYYSAVSGLETKMLCTASASLYKGRINAYRYRLGSGAWSAWRTDPEVKLQDLRPGEYSVRFQARDLAGVLARDPRDSTADFIEYNINIVEQHLTRYVVVVDESADLSGNPGSPNDQQVDDFYSFILGSVPNESIDYATHNSTVNENRITPYDLRNAGLVVWHAEDRSDQNLDANTRILREYLAKGGRLILSGWDVMGAFESNVGPGDTAIYARVVGGVVEIENSFVYNNLRLVLAARTPNVGSLRNSPIGFNGSNQPFGVIPDCRADPAKLNPSQQGGVFRSWVFRPRGECIILGTLAVQTPDTVSNPYRNQPAAYLYDQSFRAVVFGFPLYFLYNDQGRQLMDAIIPHMLQGL